MRATWITSIIGGVLFGFLVRLTDVGRIDDGLNILFFFVDAIFFVFGIPQLREDYRGAKGLMGLFNSTNRFPIMPSYLVSNAHLVHIRNCHGRHYKGSRPVKTRPKNGCRQSLVWHLSLHNHLPLAVAKSEALPNQLRH